MLLLVTYVLFALGISFLCSILEASLLSMTAPAIQSAKATGARWATKMEALKSDIDKPLSAILTLNTIAHTMGATGAGVQYQKIYGDTGEALFAAGLTLAILIFTEIIPKTLGARYARFFAPGVTVILPWMQFILAPLVWACGYITRLITRGKEVQQARHREELLAVTDLGEQEGVIQSEESAIVRNILSLGEVEVISIMTPRPVIFMLAASTTFARFAEIIADKPFSRVPVFGKNRDEILGFVLRSDALLHCIQEPDECLEKVMRPLEAVDMEMRVDRLFKHLLKEGSHLVMVHDQYGTTVGLVTLEDVLETIVGVEILDEKDKVADLQTLARNLWEERADRMGLRVRDIDDLPLIAVKGETGSEAEEDRPVDRPQGD